MKPIDIVYRTVCVHKKVTAFGVANTTGLPRSLVDKSLEDLVNLGRIQKREEWQKDGEFQKAPCYIPAEMFNQPKLFDDTQSHLEEK